MKVPGLILRNATFLLAFIFWTYPVAAQEYRIGLSPQKSQNTVQENTFDKSSYVFSFEGLHVLEVKTDMGMFSELILPKGHYVGETGSPKLPALNSLIEIPYGAEVSLVVQHYNVQEFVLEDYDIKHPLMPVQPSIRKNQDPGEVPFIYKSDQYLKSSYIEPDLANIEVLGSLRGSRIARLTVAPVSYNPSKGTIRVYNDIEIEVHYSGTDPDSMAYHKASVFSPYFQVVHDKLLSSFSGPETMKSFTDLPRNPVRMLLISVPEFKETLQPFIRWQTEKGFEVIERYTNLIGSSPSAIKSFIAGEYHSSTPERPAPTFVVIAGDVSKIPASSIGSATGEVTDLYYAAVDGDFFPDMYYGRLSARNEQELKNQIDKIIYYQKYEFEDPSYLNDVTLIAGSDNFWNQLILQPTVKYGAQNYFHAANGFANINLYLSNYDGVYEPDKTSVSMINYTAHCTPTTWSGPLLTTEHIHQMSNTGKYPLVIGNCCQSALYSLPESIAEAWVRAENRGAIAYVGSAPDTHWYEDFYWSVGAFRIAGNNAGYVPSTSETTLGAFDAPFHYDYLPVGALQFVGNLAITEAHIRGYASQSNTLWYWQGYHTFGDPSTIIYLTEAEENDIEHLPVLPLGQQSFSIKALPGSYVALSTNGVLIGAGFVDDSGEISISVDQIQTEETIRIVVTKPQFKPYIMDISSAALTGPYVVYESYSINDAQGNSNQQADYGETISLRVGLQNIGSAEVGELRGWLHTDDQYVSLANPDVPVVFSGMVTEAGKNISYVDDAFSLHIGKDTPNKHRAEFTMVVSDGQNEWLSGFFITIYAPVFYIDHQFVINDSYDGNNNNRLDPGETINLGFRIYNNGGAQASKPMVSLKPSSPYLTYEQDSINLSNINPGEMRMASFSVHANQSSQDGTVVPFEVSVSDGHTKRFQSLLTIGQAPAIRIGDKNVGSNQFPFYNLYKSNRTQMIYLAEELGAGEKTIKQIGFEIIEVANKQNTLNNFTIKIKHTDISQFSSSFFTMLDAETVFQSAGYQMPLEAGWHYWNINGFQYDGRRNLIIEINWGQNPGWTSPFFRVASTELNRNRVAYGITDHQATAPFSGVSPIRPNLFLAFETPPPQPSYAVNFLVKNGDGHAMELASVKIGSKTQLTGPAGVTTFNLYPGNYTYEIFTNASPSSIESSFALQNTSRSFVANFYEVSFNLKNSKSNEIIPDAQIALNGQAYESGKYLINDLPSGQYQFTISRTGFLDLGGVFNLLGQNLELDLMMIPDTIVSASDRLSELHHSMTIFPNPARGHVTVAFPQHMEQTSAEADMIDHLGRLVSTQVLPVHGTNKTIQLDTSGLPPGIYFIRVRKEHHVMIEKLILY
jgi:hypothetical protein